MMPAGAMVRWGMAYHNLVSQTAQNDVETAQKRTAPSSVEEVAEPSPLPPVSVELSEPVSSEEGVEKVVVRVVLSLVMVLTSSSVPLVVEEPGVSELLSVPVVSVPVVSEPEVSVAEASVPVVWSLPPPRVVVAIGVVMTVSSEEMVVRIVETYEYAISQCRTMCYFDS